MERIVYKNAVINGILTDITVENGKIASLAPTAESGIDCKGLTARAGLFDIHAHGCMGHDTMDGDIPMMAKVLASHGVTA